MAGARDYAPSLTAVISWGLATGIAMGQSALTVPQALGMSLLVYAGSSQLAVLPLFAAKMPIWTILLTAAMVNTRFIVFSAGLTDHFSYLSFARRLLLGFFNGDLIYLRFLQRGYRPGYQPGKEGFFWGMAATSWLAWQAASIAGILLASTLPDTWGFGLAGTLALVPVMINAIVNRSMVMAVIVASAVSILSFPLPYRMGLPLSVIAALIAGLSRDAWVERRLARVLARDGARPR